MKLKEYLIGRSQTEFALEIGAQFSDLSSWKNEKRPVPPVRCVAIERATGGQVTRRDLRPNDWADIWPELAEV